MISKYKRREYLINKKTQKRKSKDKKIYKTLKNTKYIKKLKNQYASKKNAFTNKSLKKIKSKNQLSRKVLKNLCDKKNKYISKKRIHNYLYKGKYNKTKKKKIIQKGGNIKANVLYYIIDTNYSPITIHRYFFKNNSIQQTGGTFTIRFLGANIFSSSGISISSYSNKSEGARYNMFNFKYLYPYEYSENTTNNEITIDEKTYEYSEETDKERKKNVINNIIFPTEDKTLKEIIDYNIEIIIYKDELYLKTHQSNEEYKYFMNYLDEKELIILSSDKIYYQSKVEVNISEITTINPYLFKSHHIPDDIKSFYPKQEEIKFWKKNFDNSGDQYDLKKPLFRDKYILDFNNDEMTCPKIKFTDYFPLRIPYINETRNKTLTKEHIKYFLELFQNIFDNHLEKKKDSKSLIEFYNLDIIKKNIYNILFENSSHLQLQNNANNKDNIKYIYFYEFRSNSPYQQKMEEVQKELIKNKFSEIYKDIDKNNLCELIAYYNIFLHSNILLKSSNDKLNKIKLTYNNLELKDYVYLHTIDKLLLDTYDEGNFSHIKNFLNPFDIPLSEKFGHTNDRRQNLQNIFGININEPFEYESIYNFVTQQIKFPVYEKNNQIIMYSYHKYYPRSSDLSYSEPDYKKNIGLFNFSEKPFDYMYLNQGKILDYGGEIDYKFNTEPTKEIIEKNHLLMLYIPIRSKSTTKATLYFHIILFKYQNIDKYNVIYADYSGCKANHCHDINIYKYNFFKNNIFDLEFVEKNNKIEYKLNIITEEPNYKLEYDTLQHGVLKEEGLTKDITICFKFIYYDNKKIICHDYNKTYNEIDEEEKANDKAKAEAEAKAKEEPKDKLTKFKLEAISKYKNNSITFGFNTILDEKIIKEIQNAETIKKLNEICVTHKLNIYFHDNNNNGMITGFNF